MNKLNFVSKLGKYANKEWAVRKKMNHAHWSSWDKYPCANPDGPVDNSNCPEDDPLCHCPCPELKPEMPEDVQYTTVCDEIMNHPLFGKGGENPECLGCMWSDLDLSYSCECPCVGDKFKKFVEYIRTYSTYWDTPPQQPLWREAQMQLLQSSTAMMTVFGDLTVRPGQIIHVVNVTPSEKPRKSAGRWLISNIQHNIKSGVTHDMTLGLMRDSAVYNPNEVNIPGFWENLFGLPN